MVMVNGTGCIKVGAVAFVTGLFAGIAVGIALAPQSGARTRRQLSNLAADIRERASLMAEDTKEAVDNIVERGKRLVS
jgi:gas vesicle protein